MSSLPAKKVLKLYQSLCVLLSAFMFHSEQGDELLVECHYQTLDRDFMTFVSDLSPHHGHHGP